MHENVRRIKELISPLTEKQIGEALEAEVLAHPWMAQAWMVRLYNMASAEIAKRHAANDRTGIEQQAQAQLEAEEAHHA